MATFKVGQGVKKVSHRIGGSGGWGAPIGAEGVIGSAPDDPENRGQWGVLWDGYQSTHDTHEYCVAAYMIAPLTDPKADAFIESLKKMKPYMEPSIVEYPAKVKS